MGPPKCDKACLEEVEAMRTILKMHILIKSGKERKVSKHDSHFAKDDEEKLKREDSSQSISPSRCELLILLMKKTLVSFLNGN